jgi:hypothetical protein
VTLTDHPDFIGPVPDAMTTDAQSRSHEAPLGAGSAGDLGKLYRVGRLLVALCLIAAGAGCVFEPWLASSLGPILEFFSFHALTGLALILAGAGVAIGRGARVWALIVGAAALLTTIASGVIPYRDIAGTRDLLIRIALIGAMLMLMGTARGRESRVSWWSRMGRWIFAAGALVCIAAQAIFSIWLQDGFDMFYFNYDGVTLFNSIWSWSYPLGSIFGLLALAGATAVFFRKLARAGAILVAAASILYLPLMFLYRLDDFCGGGRALVELGYEWTLDLGLAGGALILAGVLWNARRDDAAERLQAAGAFGVLARTRWVRIAMIATAVMLFALIAGHGLIPFAFYEANSWGDAKLGDLTARLYEATYVPARGNSYWSEKLARGMASAGPAGRACAAGDPQGCATAAAFYFELGWNWSRTWLLSAKGAALFTARCNGGDAMACFNLGVQYDQGHGVATDATKAAGLYEKACDARVADGCQRLADDYWYGIGVPADKHKGATLMKKGCALGGQWACKRLDFMRHDDPDGRPEYDQ